MRSANAFAIVPSIFDQSAILHAPALPGRRVEAGQLPHGELGLRQVQALQLINLHKRGRILEQQYEGGVVVGKLRPHNSAGLRY